ncbi:MAG: aminodeoxychorismate synthase component I [Chromatiales bacterium]
MNASPRIVEIPYLGDSVPRFERLAERPWCVMLDSGRPRSMQGRYDILTADPYITLTTWGDHTEVTSRSGTVVSYEDPFLLLKRTLGEPGRPAGPLPFYGGALGYFAYDLGRCIERLPTLARADVPMPDMAVGIYDWAVIVDHETQQAFLVAQGRDEKVLDEWSLLIEVAGVEAPVAYCPSFTVRSAVTANMTREHYADCFRRLKKYLRDGDCYQVNFAQRFSARAEGVAWDAYKYLRQLNPAPHSAFMLTSYGAILSSSPERFLKVRDGRVETRPIKGTRPRASDPGLDRALAKELRDSPKDQAENVMIVDLLRNDIGRSCRIGSVSVPSLFAIETFATVHHLVSTVTGELADGQHAIDLLRGCFPGGSITGAPKVRAMQIIEELEPHRRNVYCGAIGYIGFEGNMDTSIAIRTLVCADGWMHAWAGGGVVMDSVMEDEYQESLDKAAALIRLFMCTEGQFVAHEIVGAPPLDGGVLGRG